MQEGGKGGVFFEQIFFLQTFTAQPIQPTTHTNNTWRLPGWLRASCGRHMRALRLCHTTSQWRGTTAEQHGCCVSMTTVLLLLSQHIDRTACEVNMLTEERVVRELLGGAPPCRRLSREAHSSRTSYSSTARRTRKSPTEVPSARAVRVAPRSAICQLPASARSS